jgi:ElaB/YqjD/DUF883 family membrane-anchored ribosome-binding protein
MNEDAEAGHHEAGMLTADVVVLLAATKDVSDEIVVKAHQRLETALKSGKQVDRSMFGKKPVARAQATKQVVCEHPFEGHYSGTS